MTLQKFHKAVVVTGKPASTMEFIKAGYNHLMMVRAKSQMESVHRFLQQSTKGDRSIGLAPFFPR